MPSATVTASHVTQGRVEYESTIPQSTDDGLDLWEADPVYSDEATGWQFIVQIPVGTRDFSLFQNIKTGSRLTVFTG